MCLHYVDAQDMTSTAIRTNGCTTSTRQPDALSHRTQSPYFRVDFCVGSCCAGTSWIEGWKREAVTSIS